MRRYTARPYGGSVSGTRLLSMLMAILVLGMLYNRLKDPHTWRAFADDKEPAAAQVVAETPSELENIVAGPNDLDEDEVASVQDLFEMVTDKTPLKPQDMHAYWRLMDWSHTQPFAELEKRSHQDIAFTQLFDQPEKYRGKPIRLRMHVRRILESDAPKDQPSVDKVYEAWGWTDESRSFPYVVVFKDLPPGLPIGTDIRTEIVFAGYFLKVMSYKAFDNNRGAPLLVGRAKLISTPPPPPPSKTDPWIIPIVLFGSILFIGASVWLSRSARKKSKMRMLPDDLSAVTTPVNFGTDNPFGDLDLTGPDGADTVATPLLVDAGTTANLQSTTTSSID